MEILSKPRNNKMDRNLKFSPDLLDRVITEFAQLSSEHGDISFRIWNEVPENYQRSYYNNELLINPSTETFEEWKLKLPKRPNPIYSVALIDEQIISSVYGAGRPLERSMNLWATHAEYRRRGIGKIVLLNFIKNAFENNPDLTIRAWDVSSQQVNDVLNGLGFSEKI